MERIAQNIAAVIKGSVRTGEDMRRHTSFKIGGPADLYIEPETTAELAAVLAKLRQENVPYFILGGGTNLLVSDEGYRGAVVRLGGEFMSWTYTEKTVRAGAAVKLAVLAKDSCGRGLGGLEFAAGIPGTVGGALKMNAGAHGHSLEDILSSALLLTEDLELHTFLPKNLNLSYRKSSLPAKSVVCVVELALQPADSGNLAGKCRDMLAYRQDRQPRQPNAGSIFKNPSQAAAGWLIEAAGLKGLREGGAKISEVHANFIVNCGGATAKDVLTLIEKAKTAVFARFDIELELEICMLGY